MKNKSIVSFFISLIFLLLFIREWPDHYFHLTFCDVGQGDAILLSSGFTQILIDGGKDQSVLRCLGEHMAFWDKKVEIVVATHPDADHIGGLIAVFEQYSVDSIITNGDFKQTPDFDEFKRGVLRKQSTGTTHFIFGRNSTISLFSTIKLTSVWPITNISETRLWDTTNSEPDNGGDYNNGSIVLFLSYGKMNALLAGDLELEGETALVHAGLIKEAHILKVGHHGSKTSTSQDFISLVRPEVSVISSGKNNSYGHPNDEVLERLRKIGSSIVRTDTDGSIEYVTDGTNLWRN